MKGKHYLIFAIVILLITAILGIVGWPYIKAGIRYATGSEVIGLAKREYDAATPGIFFVQVVDHKQQSIANAEITFRVIEPNYPEVYNSGGWSRNREMTEFTDENGRISLNEEKVISIRIINATKPGYVWIRPKQSNRTGTREYEIYPTFNYSYATAPPVGTTPQENVHQADPDDPYILIMEPVED